MNNLCCSRLRLTPATSFCLLNSNQKLNFTQYPKTTSGIRTKKKKEKAATSTVVAALNASNKIIFKNTFFSAFLRSLVLGRRRRRKRRIIGEKQNLHTRPEPKLFFFIFYFTFFFLFGAPMNDKGEKNTILDRRKKQSRLHRRTVVCPLSNITLSNRRLIISIE